MNVKPDPREPRPSPDAWLLFAPPKARPPQWAGLRRGRKSLWRSVETERRARELMNALKAVGVEAWIVSKRQLDAKKVARRAAAVPAVCRTVTPAEYERAAFEEFKRDMAVAPVPPSVLPVPIDAPIRDRRPGLSKSAPKRHP